MPKWPWKCVSVNETSEEKYTIYKLISLYLSIVCQNLKTSWLNTNSRNWWSFISWQHWAAHRFIVFMSINIEAVFVWHPLYTIWLPCLLTAQALWASFCFRLWQFTLRLTCKCVCLSIYMFSQFWDQRTMSSLSYACTHLYHQVWQKCRVYMPLRASPFLFPLLFSFFFWGCTSNGIYVPCIYLNAKWMLLPQ